MTTLRPFLRGVARGFNPYGAHTPVQTRTTVDLRVSGLERDVAAVRRDAYAVGSDLAAAIAVEAGPIAREQAK